VKEGMSIKRAVRKKGIAKMTEIARMRDDMQ